MKRYIKSSRATVEEYRGYFITYNAYGSEEYTVDIDGDDVWCDTFSEAQEFIDDLCRMKEVNKKLGI